MRPVLHCTVLPGAIRAELRVRARVEWAAEASWNDTAELRAAVAELAARTELPVASRAVHFQVDATLVQLRSLRGMPPVSARQLVRLVSLTPHRYFRRAATSLVVDAAWSGPRGKQVVLAVAMSRELADALVAGAGEAGLVIEEITPILPAGAPLLSLLPPDVALRRAARSWRLSRRLGIGAAVAWVGLGLLVFGHYLFERHRIASRLDEIRDPVAAVLAAEAASDSTDRMIRRLDTEGARKGEVVAALFRITAALPDSTWLTQLRIDSAGVGLVAGAAQRPTAVVAALESRARVVAPHLEGRTAHDLVAGRSVERFAIGFGDDGGPQ